MTYGDTPAQEPLGHEIKILVNYSISWYGPGTGVEKIFFKIHQFYNFYPKITSP